jgi:hypothetical protein
MRVIEREHEHYEVVEVPYGKIYSWRPERVVFECDCGEVLSWTAPETVCPCGARYAEAPATESPPDDRTLHPWHEEYEEWRRMRLANNLRREYFDFVKAGDDG